MFVGRKKELEFLNSIYLSSKFEFVVVYGRRRLGKTALIKEFIQGKEAIYIMATQSDVSLNLKSLSSAILSYLSVSDSSGTFANFEEALRHCFELARAQKLILVIDEYPFAAKSDPSLNSVLQKLIDEYKDQSNLKLILCGSLITYMEEEMFAYKAPLYGRKTGQIKLNPFSFKEVRLMFPDLDPQTQAEIYGVFGGTPFYLEFYNPKLPLMENIRSSFFTDNSVIKEEPHSLLKQEMRDPERYESILRAIASGHTRMNQISDFVNMPSGNTANYLLRLIEMDLVVKRLPSGETKRNKTVYQIKDHLFLFWYATVPENETRIALGVINKLVHQTETNLPAYMGHIFEEVCMEYLWELARNDECPVYFRELGPWWGANPKTKLEEEIDIIGLEDHTSILVGECKWTNSPVGVSVLRTLERRSSLFSHPNQCLFIFSKSGFTNELKAEAAGRSDLFLVSFQQMVDYFDSHS